MEKKKPIIFIINGKARSGKTTIANMIADYYEDKNKKTVHLMYAESIKNYAKKIMDWDGSEETKPRTFLQVLGTEIIRNEIDENFFVKRMIEDIQIYSYFCDVIIISDARFLNEIQVPKQTFENVILIKVEHPNLLSELTKEQQKHMSENALNYFNEFDYTIYNDASLEDLKSKVYDILDEVKI